MNYTLNQLQIFLKIVQTESVTKAAEELNLTQPAVSIQLRNFQDQFDIPLTEVVGRKIYITDFGKEIAKSAERILEEVYNINYRTLEYKGKLFGKLKISIVSTGQYIMPYYLSGFINKNPSIDLIMDVTNKQKVVESLENNEVDFALVSIVPNNFNIKKIDLLQNKLYMVGKMNPKLKKTGLTKEEINGLPFIFRERGSGTRTVMEKFIEKSSFDIDRKMELTSNEAVKQAILAGLGYSIMPLIGIRNELHNNELSIIPMKGLPIKTTWSLIWLKGKKHTAAAQSFIDYITVEKNRIVKSNFDWYEKY